MNVPSRRKLRMVTAFLAVLVLILVGWFVLREDGEESASSQQNDVQTLTESTGEVAPIRVEAAPARMGDLVLRLSATGLTRALQEITVSPKVGGQLSVCRLRMARSCAKVSC
jgi:hypothetical protein